MSEIAAALSSLDYEETHPNQEVPADFLKRVQSALGGALPPEYVEFLDLYPRSGGPGHAVLVAPINDADGEPVSWMELFGWEGSDDDGLRGRNRYYPDLDIKGAIVIGDDIMGNLLYMSVADPEPGAVFYYDRVEPFQASLDSLDKLSSSFLEFLQRTTIDPEV